MPRHPAVLFLLACVGACACAAGPRARAEPLVLAFDQHNAAVEFQPRVAGLFRTSGAFQEFAGQLSMDPADVTRSVVSVRLRAGRIRVAMPGGADKLRSAAYFDAAEYPEIDFRSTGMQVGTDGRLSMAGLLTIRGVTRPQTLEVSVVPGANPGQGPLGFRAMGSIRRSDYGMVADPRLIDDEIKLSIEVALQDGGMQAMQAPAREPQPEH